MGPDTGDTEVPKPGTVMGSVLTSQASKARSWTGRYGGLVCQTFWKAEIAFCPRDFHSRFFCSGTGMASPGLLAGLGGGGSRQ